MWPRCVCNSRLDLIHVRKGVLRCLPNSEHLRMYNCTSTDDVHMYIKQDYHMQTTFFIKNQNWWHSVERLFWFEKSCVEHASKVDSSILSHLSSIEIVQADTLVWPQWWSFADVSQQGIDFSKKISKIKMFFWFDFHKLPWICRIGKKDRQFRIS